MRVFLCECVQQFAVLLFGSPNFVIFHRYYLIIKGIKTISMEFKVGGRRFYKMVSPEGQEHFLTEVAPIPLQHYKLSEYFPNAPQENFPD